MIEIFADGKPLVLYRDTTLTLEYNNALFASDAIEGDVVYSFDIPVQGNEIALEFEHLPYVQSHKKHDCTIRVDGIDLVTGKLVVQRVTKIRYSVAVQVNPYPEGFASRKMTENDSNLIVISASHDTHKAQWLRFLARNVSETRFKFAPFLNENAYGNHNENFGYWNGRKKGSIVNRLFYDALNQPVVNEDLHIFNEEIRLSESDEDSHNLIVERNQQCFAPQVSLEEMLSNFVSNAKYRFVNHLSEDIRKIYIQSPKSMDGTEMQYYEFETLSAKGKIEESSWENSGWYSIECEDTESLIKNNTIEFRQPGVHSIILSGTIEQYGGDISFMIYKNVPHVNISEYNTEDILFIEHLEMEAPSSESLSWHPQSLLRKEFRFYVSGSFLNTPLRVAIFGPKYENSPILFLYYNKAMPATLDISVTGPIKSEQHIALNTYLGKFRLSSLFPDIANAQFVNVVTKDLGMCYYIDGKCAEIELLPYRDIVNSKSIDLSEFVLDRETKVENPILTNIRLTIKSIQSKTLTEKEKETAKYVYTYEELYISNLKVGDLVFVEDMGAYYSVSEDQDENGIWLNTYKEYAGDDRELSIGDGKIQNQSSTVKVPTLTTCEYKDTIGKDMLIPNIPMELKSVLSGNENDDKTDLVLLQYRGMKEAKIEDADYTMRYADMRPVLSKGFSLTTTGEDSLGEKYLRPYITIRDHSRTITYKLRVPILKALEIIRLVQPQHEEPRSQVRCVMIDNVKSMPRKISLQIDNNSSDVLCEIEAAKLD